MYSIKVMNKKVLNLFHGGLSMNLFKKICINLFIYGFSSTTLVYAAGSGAFRAEVPDAGAFGKGSAFVGEANTPSAVYYNPAGLTQIKTVQVSVGNTVIAPQVDAKLPGSGNKEKMKRNVFNVPHAYVAVPVNQKLSFGLGATSYFGLGTEWKEDSFTRYGNTKTSLENQDYMLSVAYKMTDQWSFAVGPDFDISHANKQKKLAQGGGAAPDGNFELNANDQSVGFRIATMYKVNEKHSFGLMYRSPIQHKYRGKAYMDGLDTNPSVPIPGVGTLSYQTIFGGPSYETRFTEKYTLPQSVILGYSFKPVAKLTLNADLEWMDWSSVEQEGLVWIDEQDALRKAVLGSGNPAPRDWKSVISFAVGAEYALRDNLRLRTGYYHHNTPIPEATFEASLPDSNSHGFTAGIGYDFNKNFTIDLAYSALIYEPRKVEDRSSTLTYDHNAKYYQMMNIGLVTLTYKF